MDKPSKTALVTGASRGIGASIAKRLASDGFHVLINYASSEAKAQSVLDEITSAGGSAELCGFNVADPDQVAEKMGAIQKNNGPLGVLVNNAGISKDGLLMRLKNEVIDQVLEINLKGAIYCTREASKQMMKARKGSIIQISSVVGEMGNAGQTVYASSKSGLIGFSKAAAKELASRKVRVNVITPGFICTEMTEALTEDQKSEYLRNIPLGYLGEPEDIASGVSFLASEESRYITGQVLGINGGLYI